MPGEPAPREPRAPAPARPGPSPARSPAAPRPREPAAGSPTAPAAEVGSPGASRRGDGTGRAAGGPSCRAGACRGLRDPRVAFSSRVPAAPRAIVSPRRGPCARSLARLARALPPSPAPRPRPSVSPSLSCFLPSLRPEARPTHGRAQGGSKLRLGSWAAAVGARCRVRGAPGAWAQSCLGQRGSRPFPGLRRGCF